MKEKSRRQLEIVGEKNGLGRCVEKRSRLEGGSAEVALVQRASRKVAHARSGPSHYRTYNSAIS